MDNNQKKRKIYFMGIGGTGMASVAGLMKEEGNQICGSDANMYPPMSLMLEDLKIPVSTPYSAENLAREKPDLVVVANSLSRGHVEIEYMLENNIPYTSFAALVGETFLETKKSIVVAGTHGKTTTSSLLAYLLDSLSQDPSFLIGGIPRNFPLSYRIGSGPFFVIEGDEYDTAFFDKQSKFYHYRPQFLIFNNVEFDHADIFKDLAAVDNAFAKLLTLVGNPKNIIANVDDPGVCRVLEQTNLDKKVTKVSTNGSTPSCFTSVKEISFDNETQLWHGKIESQSFGEINLTSKLGGAHNFANMSQAIACLGILKDEKLLKGSVSGQDISEALKGFKSVKRRLDHLASASGIHVYEDFAHHPTAVKKIIESFRLSHPDNRLIVAFEPKNATSRRNIFSLKYENALGLADVVLFGACVEDKRIALEERMDTNLIAEKIGPKAQAFQDNDKIYEWLTTNCKENDLVVFMSCGSFSGLSAKFMHWLLSKSST